MKKSHRIPFKAILLAIAAACLFAAFIMTGCDSCDSDPDDQTEHSHVYNTDEWTYDETGHWHACTGEDCEEKSEYAEHTFDDGVLQSDNSYLYTCTVCGYSETSTSEIYKLTLTNMGGTALSGIDVNLYNTSGKLVASGTTGTTGNIRFKGLASGTYYAYIDTDDLPLGYYLDDNQVVLTADEKSVTQKIPSSVITSEETPSNKVYTTGDVMYDFTITCMDSSGKEYEVTLSEYLKEYNAVFLNFFYTGCSPCRAEMPYMQQAYASAMSKSGVGLICFDYTGNGDTTALMCSFISEYSLTFDFTYDSAGYYAHFGVSAFPTTVVIDRYGCVALIDTGSNTSASAWTTMFDYYTAEEYNPTYASGKSDTESGSTLVESDVEMPESEEIVEAIVTTNDYTTADTFTFSNYMEGGSVDAYNWPWIIGEETISGVSNYIQTSNKGIVGGYSIIVIDVSLTAGQAVLFDYIVSTETDYDIFYVQVDTVLQTSLSGGDDTLGAWETCIAYVAKYSGDYQLTLYYQKDSSKDLYNDTVYVSNLRIVDSSELSTATYSNDVLYNAANNYTDDTTIDLSDYGEGYGYLNYVSVYLASDGYYHVGSKTDGSDPEDDPYLLADLYYGTPWYNDMSIWYEVYDYAGEDDLETFNSKLADAVQIGTAYEAFEDYSWAQNNCPWGYVPVNEELHDMLVAFVSTYGRKTGSYAYDNQWLELCRYYVHYGADHATGDECYSTDNIAETYGFRLAAQLGEVDSTKNYDNDSALVFTAEMETLLTPRGNYYAFTVSTSGIYRIYSYDYQLDADAAPYAFLVDKNGNVIAESELDDLANVEGFIRESDTGTLTLKSDGTALVFTPKYSATYQFKLTGANSSTKITDGDTTTYFDGSTANGTYTISLELTAGTAITLILSGSSADVTLDYEISDTSYDFGIYYYLTADTTYYIATSFGSTEETGSYDVGIYYIGDHLSYFTTLTTGAYYTYAESTDASGNTTYTYYLPTRVGQGKYALNPADNCWYTLDENNEYDQPIYIDLVGTTWFNFYSSYTIETAAANNSTLGIWTTAQLAIVNNYIKLAKASTETITVQYGNTTSEVSLTGCYKATAELVNCINILVNGGDSSSSSTYASNAWMLTAYYLRVVA